MDSFKTLINKIKAFTKNALSFFMRLGSFLNFNKLQTSRKAQSSTLQTELDKRLVYSLSKSRIPNLRQLKYIKRYLNPKELRLIYVSLLVIVVSTLFSGVRFYSSHLEVVPKAGGTYVEGSIGAPQHINPLYASVSDIDSDLAYLIYSSLFKRDKTGGLTKDLVESYSISDDNKIYSFTIKPNVLWHDGESLSTDDVIYTFNLIKDVQYKSPLRASFSGVDIEKEDDRRFKFILSEPYAAFLELLTFGIMPAHLWQQIPAESANLAEFNLRPVGSGPYMLKQYVKGKTGNIREYSLVANEDYYGDKPLIDISFKFFLNFEEAISALNDNSVNGISYLSQELKGNIIAPKTYNFYKLNLPQMTVVFFNQKNNQFLADKEIRQALALATDKQGIVDQVLMGDAQVIDGPILPNSFAYNDSLEKYAYQPEEALKKIIDKGFEKVTISEEDVKTIEEKIVQADQAATEEGDEEEIEISDEERTKLALGPGEWLKKGNDYFIIRLTTVDNGENQRVVEAVKADWEKIGIKTDLEILSPVEMQTEIRERNFEALFYGQVIGADPDPYAFWHSSQTGESGFNIANFANKEVDQLLEDARIITDQVERRAKYSRFQEIITTEVPGVFMFSPVYTYVQDKKIKGFDIQSILSPKDRFDNIQEWYIETKKKLIW